MTAMIKCPRHYCDIIYCGCPRNPTYGAVPDAEPAITQTEQQAEIERLRDALEKKCETCDGGRWLDPGTGKHVTCHDCEGRGFVPTEHGEQVLAFLRRYLR